jgi:NADH-quinone oxidoreductase subunit F
MGNCANKCGGNGHDHHHDHGDQPINLAEVDAIVAEIGGQQSDLIPLLLAIQKKFNYLPEEALRRISEITDISPASIEGVSTFYAHFRRKPAGQHTIKVCVGTACHVKDAHDVFGAFRDKLGLQGDEDTDKQRLFTVNKVACIGCCMLAPAVQIDDITYGFVDQQKVGDVMRDFLESEKQTVNEEEPATGRNGHRGEVRICLCSSCLAAGSGAVFHQFQTQAKDLHLNVRIKAVGCLGISFEAPLVEVATGDAHTFRYGKTKVGDVHAILTRHFKPTGIGPQVRAAVSNLLDKLYTVEGRQPGAAAVTRYQIDVRDEPIAAYTAHQKPIAMEHAGLMHPLDLDDYLKHDGFQALKRAYTQMLPEEVVGEIVKSGLRGRGGGGFPTGKKWTFVREAKGDIKYIICNGDEGDPGAFMDRMILESFPFRVLEGMAIGAHAIGAKEGVLYIRHEYPLASKRITRAIQMLTERGYLGDNIMGTGESLHLRVVEGAGAFVCGEETALIKSVMGERGMPVLRPPFPAQSGLWGKPTLINNVETFALVPWIIRNGADKFASMGTATSKGTKTFAMAGKIRRGGLVEVPMGMTLRQIIEEIGGGIEHDKKLKAVQIGGPSGGCMPASLADTPVDYESLQSAGAMMGSGGLIVLDEDDCMVDIARYFLSFTQQESCGKCTFCRLGTKRMLEILTILCEGKGAKGDLEKLEVLSQQVQAGSICGLGRTAPNPVLTTLRYFREEYEAHLQGYCPARKCKALIRYRITDDCIGCTRCATPCPVDAIPITPYRVHTIDQDLCTKCDNCRVVCPVDAVVIDTGKPEQPKTAPAVAAAAAAN